MSDHHNIGCQSQCACGSDSAELRDLVIELTEALELWAECIGPNGETRMPSGPADLIARAKAATEGGEG